MSQMLFRPLRQIADKFNTLQMGMVAAERVFTILEKEAHILDEGHIEKNHVEGLYHLRIFTFHTHPRRFYMEYPLIFNPARRLQLLGLQGLENLL